MENTKGDNFRCHSTMVERLAFYVIEQVALRASQAETAFRGYTKELHGVLNFEARWDVARLQAIQIIEIEE